MFEALRLLGSTSRSIELQTHLGNDIVNEVGLEPEQIHIDKYNSLLNRFRLNWTQRKPPVGVYNCMGHVWACRRTSVYDDLERQLGTIFADDGYRIVGWPNERLFIGDLVTYWGSAGSSRMFYHVGIVSELRSSLGGSSVIPWILSKWDDTSGEVLHHYIVRNVLGRLSSGGASHHTGGDTPRGVLDVGFGQGGPNSFGPVGPT